MTKEQLEALDKVVEKFSAMSKEEFEAMMAEQDRLMREAIINGTDHLGLTIWYMQDPEGCRTFTEMVLEDHKNSLK